MRVNFYLIKNGILKRKENTVYFISKEVRYPLPINKIHSIYCYGRISVTSGVLSYLAKEGITVHFFGFYGHYEGSFYPRETLVSGDVVVRQAAHYLDGKKRLEIAKEIIGGCAWNIRRNLLYYKLDEEASQVEGWEGRIQEVGDIPQLMNVEGNIWSVYYGAFDKILPEEFRFEKRTRQPPGNEVNALVSFGNSLVYSNVLSEIYHSQLHPAISFLHEPFERRFSLSLDLSEVFKPFLGDRVIFKVFNKGMITKDHFEKELGGCLLTEEGRRTFVQEFDARLKTTIKHRSLGRNVSYQRLIRLECYKLIKHLLDGERYSAFKIWW